jgi:trehalose 6-phosphate synthase
MKFNLTLLLAVVVSVGLIVFGFTFFQVINERNKLENDLTKRVVDGADEFYEKNTFTGKDNNKKLVSLATNISRRFRLIGVALYYKNDSIIILNSDIQDYTSSTVKNIEEAVESDSSMGFFTNADGKSVFQYIIPIKDAETTLNALVFYADAGFIKERIKEIWIRNFIRWFFQVLVVTIVIILIIQWGIFKPINKIIVWMNAARRGGIEKLEENPPSGFLSQLHTEIKSMAQAMYEAKVIAEEEAKLRTTSEAIWTAERLKEEMKKLLNGRMLIVVSNREPYMHVHEGKNIKYIVPASGMVTALEPILKSCGGLWIASGSGDADKETVDKNDKIKVPPEEPAYTLKRVWLTKEEEDRFYYGFSNEGLWPLCHIAHTRPNFRKEDWTEYQSVNKRYARSVLEEIKQVKQPFILIQDYHFALLPQMIKKERPDAKVAIFWHIPWPNPESFGICPWQQEILMGMLGADLVGFHTQSFCNNFLETVAKSLEARVMWDNFSVQIAKQISFIKPFPISIAFTLRDYDNKIDTTQKPADLLADNGIKGKHFGIGVDRIDYTKGLLEKFHSIERFFEKYPSYLGKLTFIQIGAPSRTLIKNYADLVSALDSEANRINWRFKQKDWKAILFLKRHHSHEEIIPYYKSSDFCLVSSLHDGMNLVSKEFIASRNDNKGVLMLSQFAGAALDLEGSIVFNPYDIEKTADLIKAALEMPVEEQQQRMQLMRQTVVGHNVYSWAASLVRTMVSIQGR